MPHFSFFCHYLASQSQTIQLLWMQCCIIDNSNQLKCIICAQCVQRAKKLSQTALKNKKNLNAKLCTVSGFKHTFKCYTNEELHPNCTPHTCCRSVFVYWLAQPSVRQNHLAKFNRGPSCFHLLHPEDHISSGHYPLPQPTGMPLSLDTSGANRWLTPAEAAGCLSSHLHDHFTDADSAQTGVDCCGPEPDPIRLLIKHKAPAFYGLLGWLVGKVMLKRGSQRIQDVSLQSHTAGSSTISLLTKHCVQFPLLLIICQSMSLVFSFYI